MKKLGKEIHWEEAKDIHASIVYCTKEESRLEGPWTFGTKPLSKKEASLIGG